MRYFPSLKKNTDFRRIYKEGAKTASPNFVMYVLKNEEGISRLGISASRRYGNSVERHRFQRRIREIFRSFSNVTKDGYDMIIVARNKAKYSDHSELCEDFRKLLISHNIFTGSK